ncbi:MAG: hypothetical protein AAF329_15535 [Cyanobacteria bacterium P01_A01_bin.17]
MRNFKVLFSLLFSVSIVPAFAQFSRAETYQGVDFPQGEISFADRVVRLDYNAAGGKVSGKNREASHALGIPDKKYVSLGNATDLATSSDLVLEFTNNRLVDRQGPDLYIFETGPAVEATSVEVSVDGTTWYALGRIEGSTRSIDLANYQLPQNAQYRFVRLRDYPDGNTSGSPYAGPDIDAVGAIGTVAATPGAPVSQGSNQPQRQPSQGSTNSQKGSCPLTKSVFTAMGNSNYSMVFAPASGAFASVPYTVTIGHTQRGPIDLFDYSASVGYPSPSLNLRKDQNRAARSFSIYFFDANLRPVYDGEQATYAFVSGLGAYDYYSNVDTGSRTNEMGSVMWKRSCS